MNLWLAVGAVDSNGDRTAVAASSSPTSSRTSESLRSSVTRDPGGIALASVTMTESPKSFATSPAT